MNPNELTWLRRAYEKLQALLLSRKLWAAVAATIVALQQTTSPEEAANAVAAIWIAFIFGTGLEDGLSRR